MVTEALARREYRLEGFSPIHLGLVGQMATSWAVAGGLLGAVVVAFLLVAREVSASFGFLTATLFFAGGWLIGFLHGGIVGYIGRPDDVSRVLALKRLGLAVLYAVPSLLLAWCLAMCLTLGAVGVVAGRPALLAFGLVGAAGLAAAVAWAAVEARSALEHLCRRWPDSRALLSLLGMAFMALLPFFLVLRPEIWFLGVRPTPQLAVLMAAIVTVWVGGPLAAVGILAVRAWRRRHPRQG
jgi:hypothetical protein